MALSEKIGSSFLDGPAVLGTINVLNQQVEINFGKFNRNNIGFSGNDIIVFNAKLDPERASNSETRSREGSLYEFNDYTKMIVSLENNNDGTPEAISISLLDPKAGTTAIPEIITYTSADSNNNGIYFETGDELYKATREGGEDYFSEPEFIPQGDAVMLTEAFAERESLWAPYFVKYKIKENFKKKREL